MPDYKRKKVKRSLPRAPKKRNDKVNNDISMKSFKTKEKQFDTDASMRVLKGNFERKLRVKKFFVSILCFFLVCGIITAIFPIGIGESIGNGISLLGVGKYPCEVEGTQTINAVSKGLYYYVLTDTHLMAFSRNGKQLFSSAHGFSAPVLETTKTRALLIDQGSQRVAVYNLQGLVKDFETKSPIITANICGNGTVAIVTKPENYASTVTLYNRNFKKIYEWNSAKETVNGIVLSRTGKKMAVSTVNVSGAQFQTNIYVLTQKSAEFVFTLGLNDKPVMDMYSYNSGFYVITEDAYRHIKWGRYSTKTITATGGIDMVRNCKSGTVLVFNRTNDRSDNTVILVSKAGRKISEFKASSIINDIEMFHRHIYCADDSTVTLYDKKGTPIYEGECGYGCVRLAVLGSHSVAVINDNNIEKLVLQEKR